MDKLYITIIILIGLNLWLSWLLSKKPTTHNEISRLSQKNKRNNGDNNQNDITPQIQVKQPKKGLKSLLRRKNKNNGKD